jgi:hypothetical protein
VRLARLHADRRAAPEMMALVGEARQFFDNPGNEGGAGQFYNTAVPTWS